MTMKRYRVTYTNSIDDGCPNFSCVIRAYDREHLEDKFFSNPDDLDWKILKVERLKEEV